MIHRERKKLRKASRLQTAGSLLYSRTAELKTFDSSSKMTVWHLAWQIFISLHWLDGFKVDCSFNKMAVAFSFSGVIHIVCSQGPMCLSPMYSWSYAPRVYVPKVLCSQDLMYSWSYVHRVLCSQVPMFLRSYIHRVLCLKVLCSQGLMLLKSYVPRILYS